MNLLQRRTSILVLGPIVGFVAAQSVWGGMMGKKGDGYFSGIGSHHASGHAVIETNAKGHAVLTIHKASIDKVPDGRVYLAKEFDYRNGVEVGKLTTFTGDLHFAIPASVNVADYNTVVVWCKQFDVGIGQARLEPSDHKAMSDSMRMQHN